MRRWLIRRFAPGWLLVIGCSATPEPCTPAKLGELEAACVAQVLLVCRDAPEPSAEGDAEAAIIASCPAARAVFERCEAERQKWISCNG